VKIENTRMCVTVNCKVCRSAIALYSHVVLSDTYKVSIKPTIQSKTPSISHASLKRDNINNCRRVKIVLLYNSHVPYNVQFDTTI
jgi:hypothetical protein